MDGNQSVDKISSRQLKAALALLRWSVADLAEASGLSEPTIWRRDNDDGPLGGRPATVAKIIKALERAGIVFVGEADGGPGVCLPKRRLGVGNRAPS
jgi:transcriptional regulator with XRE-family HTH domain